MNCTICLRDKDLTKHHLIPVSRHKNKKIKAAFSKEELSFTVDVCRECHNQLHALISEKEMAESYNTMTKLLDHEGVAKYTNWVRKRQPECKISVRSSKQKRNRR